MQSAIHRAANLRPDNRGVRRWQTQLRFRFAPSRPLPTVPVLARVKHRASRILLSGLEELIRTACRLEGPNIFEKLLSALGVRYVTPPGEWERIPDRGPLVVVANHPTGLLDGVIAAALCLRRRADVRILVNHLLPCHSAVDPFLIRVDPYARRGSVERNRIALRQAVDWLRCGGALIVFPAGDVSHIDWKRLATEDPDWNPSVARLIRAGQAATVPLRIRASNSPIFHLLGIVHPRLKTIRLPFEALNKRGSRVMVRVGMPVPFRRLADLDDHDMIRHLQARNNLLGQGPASVPAVETPVRGAAVIIPRPALMERALRAGCLAESAEWAVTLFRSADDPELMYEIGRVRELTFRAAGEGTGSEVDIDNFDLHYDQLVLWNLRDGAVAGGYRIAATESILPLFGVRGLYTSTLFRISPQFFRTLGPAAELGRSFVCPQYQRQYMALLILWQAIGAWVVRHPECRYLFGPVSISAAYASASRLLLSTALLETAGDAELSQWVRPRRPFRSFQQQAIRREGRRLKLADPEQISELVASLEPDSKGMPVLLRQYLRLGGRLLAFHLDRNFANTLDGLIVVDLLRTDRKLLERYLTVEGARAFLDFHQNRCSRPGHGAHAGRPGSRQSAASGSTLL